MFNFLQSRIEILLIFLMTGVGCHQAVVFKKAQPEGLDALPAFDVAYRGKYLCASDRAIVEIHSTHVVKKYSAQVIMALKELQEKKDNPWIDDEIYLPALGQVDQTGRMDDSVSTDVQRCDTLFMIGVDGVLKSFRGDQILNFRMKADAWNVWVLSMDENMDLRLYRTALPAEIEKLQEITPVDVFRNKYGMRIRLSPSPTELREILHQKLLFHECDVLNRIAHVIEM